MQASRNGVAVAPPQHWATFMEDEGVELREQVPLAPYTTLGLGGEARYFVECGSEDEVRAALTLAADGRLPVRSEEHTSELQSQSNLVCRLLLEKKKHNYGPSHPRAR